MTFVVRVPLTESERARGERLGTLLRQARAGAAWWRSPPWPHLVETLRKIETGRVPTPAFFTVAAVAHAVGLSLDALQGAVTA